MCARQFCPTSSPSNPSHELPRHYQLPVRLQRRWKWMPSSGTRKAKAKETTKEKAKAKASNCAQHANLQRTVPKCVDTTNLHKWTLMQNSKNKFNTNCVGGRDTLHKIAGNSGHGRTTEIHTFNGLLHEFFLLQHLRRHRIHQLQRPRR